MSTVRPSTLLFFLLFSAVAPAQRKWVVSAAGGGDFTDIPPAVAAARPGDTLLVRPGTYSSFVVDKALRILGEPGAEIGNPLFAYRIENVPAGQTVLVRRIRPIELLPFPPPIVVRDNLGRIHLEDIDSDGGFDVQNSRQASFHRVSTGMPSSIWYSKVLLVQCHLEAHPALDSGPGLECGDSNVVFAEGTSRGSEPGFRGFAGPGIRLFSGRLTLAGDSATLIAAGVGGLGGTAAISASTASTLVLDRAVQLVPDGEAPSIIGEPTVVRTALPSLRADADALQLTVRLHAPGALYNLLFAGLPLTPSVSTVLGDLWVGFPFILLLDAGPVPGDGLRTTTFRLPPLPPGVHVALQSLVLRPGALQFSTPVVLTLDS